jgi:hypothetical protein
MDRRRENEIGGYRLLCLAAWVGVMRSPSASTTNPAKSLAAPAPADKKRSRRLAESLSWTICPSPQMSLDVGRGRRRPGAWSPRASTIPPVVRSPVPDPSALPMSGANPPGPGRGRAEPLNPAGVQHGKNGRSHPVIARAQPAPGTECSVRAGRALERPPATV